LLRIVVGGPHVGNTCLSFLDEVLEKQVVTGTDVIVLVGLNALSRVVLVNAVVYLHPVEDGAIDWDWIDANFDTLEVSLARN
jgi:hypothetical protein